MSAATRILAIVQKAPDISTNDSAYVTSTVGQAMQFVSTYCCLPRFPDDAAGASASAVGAATDISALTSDSLLVGINTRALTEINLTLADCTTGNATAAELQIQIRAIAPENYYYAGVTVAYSATTTQYTITSPVFGIDSEVHVAFKVSEWHVAHALKVGTAFGGTETVGSARSDELEAVAAQMAINAYRRIKLAPSDYDTAADKQALLNSAFYGEDEAIKRLLLPHRRLHV